MLNVIFYVMTDILKLVFGTFTSQAEVWKDPKITPNPTISSTLVIGDHSISHSVLLLAAVTAASQMGFKVVFFTQIQIQRLPASLQKYLPSLNPESLKKIKFFYPSTMEELLQQVASLHESTNTSPTPPSLIIVDGLDSYLCSSGCGSSKGFYSGEQSCAAHLSALLLDTAVFLTQLLQQHSFGLAPCRLIASFHSEVDTRQAGEKASSTDPILDVLNRYFKVCCTLVQGESYEAAAAGLQEVWHIYFSGTGSADASATKDSEDKPDEAQEWQLLIFPDDLVEFKLV